MSRKKKKHVKKYTTNFEYAEKHFGVSVNCGECYHWYDIKAYPFCPCCGSDELVGSR